MHIMSIINGPFTDSFFLISSSQHLLNIADCWIWTRVLGWRKEPLCQQCHNQWQFWRATVIAFLSVQTGQIWIPWQSLRSFYLQKFVWIRKKLNKRGLPWSSGLLDETSVQDVVGLNPSTGYWMGIFHITLL